MRHRQARGRPQPFSERLGLFYAAPLSAIPLLAIFGLALGKTFLGPATFGLIGVVMLLVLSVVSLRVGLNMLLRFSQGSFDLDAFVADEYRNPYTVYKVMAALAVVTLGFGMLAATLPRLAWVFVVLMVVCLPLVVMLITVHDSFIAGINVARWFHMASVIGGSYFWLLAMMFLVLMGSGVMEGALHSMLGNGWTTHLVVAVVSNYAMFVVFCMMGYVLYEKADHFGIETRAARVDRLIPSRKRVSQDDLLAQGDVEGAIEVAAEDARLSTNDARVQERYFKLLQMRGDEPSRLVPQAARWLRACASGKRYDDCARLVKQWWVPNPTMLDDTPEALLVIAKLAAQGSAVQEALLLVQHFQKTQRGSMEMPAAIVLEAEILFTHLHEPALAKAKLLDMIRLYTGAVAQIQEANAMLKMIEALEERG